MLGGLNFTVVKGETVALLGPNGSGKSTLLKTLAKSLLPLQGDVIIGGRTISDLSFRELAREVAFVPQDEHPFFPFSVREVVTMGRLAQSTTLRDTPEDVRAAEDAMQEADCLDLRDRSIMELSGGERQRVWIARALAQGAPILLLDEPSSHLDISHQIGLEQLVGRLAGKGFTVIAAVHDLNLASGMCERALLLSQGELAMDGRTEEVLSSKAIEDVYSVSFDRIRQGGKVRVLPR